MLWPAGLGMALGFSVLAADAWLVGNVPIQLFLVEACMMLHSYGDGAKFLIMGKCVY